MTGKEILNVILERENLTAFSFAKSIGALPQQMYDIQKEKIKNFSAKIASKVITVYPHYNLQWLTTGEGDMLNTIAREQLTKDPVVDINDVETKTDTESLRKLYEDLKARYSKLEEREAQLLAQLQQKDDQISQLLEIMSGRKSNVG